MENTEETKEREFRAPATHEEFVRAIAQQFKTFQRTRIQFENRRRALTQSADTFSKVDGPLSNLDQINLIADGNQEIEYRMLCLLEEECHAEPVYQALIRIKGIGPAMAAQLYASIDFSKVGSVSALWKFCGMSVNKSLIEKDGRQIEIGTADRPTKGEKLHYNPKLKSLLWLIGASFLKANSPYRKFYDARRAKTDNLKLDKDGKPWTPGHCHADALRVMVKVFLSHFWEVGRELNGLSVSAPYAFAILNHDGFEPKEEFGWVAQKEVLAKTKRQKPLKPKPIVSEAEREAILKRARSRKKKEEEPAQP